MNQIERRIRELERQISTHSAGTVPPIRIVVQDEEGRLLHETAPHGKVTIYLSEADARL